MTDETSPPPKVIPQVEALFLLAAFTSVSEEEFGEMFDRASPIAQMLFLETAEEMFGEDEEEA